MEQLRDALETIDGSFSKEMKQEAYTWLKQPRHELWMIRDVVTLLEKEGKLNQFILIPQTAEQT